MKKDNYLAISETNASINMDANCFYNLSGGLFTSRKIGISVSIDLDANFVFRYCLRFGNNF